MTKSKKIVISLLILLVFIPSIVCGYIYFKITKINIGTDENPQEGITNILLLGTDGLENESAYRSDCMIVLTIDNTHNSIKLTSLARDTYVNIPGKGTGKLNASYFWGKDQLLFKTIKNEFGIDIDKFIEVNFSGLMNIIDAVGGIEIQMTESEIASLERIGPLNSSSNIQTLTGKQAMFYSSMRDIDNAIYRDSRQRKVLLSLANKFLNLPKHKYPQLLKTLLPYVNANISTVALLNLGYNVHNILSQGNEIKQAQFPIIDDIHSKGGTYKNKGWVWLYDLNSVVVLQQFIFDDINFEDNIYLNDNSNINLNY